MTNVRVALLDTGVAGYIVDNRIKLRKQIYYDYYDEQIVISDDCSGDKTPEILMDYASKYENIKVNNSTC